MRCDAMIILHLHFRPFDPLSRDDDALNLSGSLVNLIIKKKKIMKQFFQQCEMETKFIANLKYLGVSHELFHWVFRVESVAAKDLDVYRPT
jgi:hypothetical protein